MAEKIISPGVFQNESDQSLVQRGIQGTATAIVGPTVLGQPFVPTYVTSYSEFASKFGETFKSGSYYYEYFTSMAARDFFQNGGQTLLVTRIISGSTNASTYAQASVPNSLTATVGTLSSASFTVSANDTGSYRYLQLGVPGVNDFYITKVDWLSSGQSYYDAASDTVYLGMGSTPTTDDWGNFITASINNSASFFDNRFTASYNSSTDVLTIKATVTPNQNESVNNNWFISRSLYYPGDTFNGVGQSFDNGVNGTVNNSFVLETLAWGDEMNNTSSMVGGALASGSAMNVRWEITQVNTGSGTFTLAIRSGNDNTTQPNYLETWPNLSLDPALPNFISRVIGDYKPVYKVDTDGAPYIDVVGSYANASQYVRVKSVNYPQIDSIDNNGNYKTAQYSTSLPLLGSGSYGGSFAGGVKDTNLPKLMNENITSTNIQGFTSTDYVTAFSLLSNKDEYQFNVLLAPGISFDTTGNAVSAMISTCEGRGDAIAIVDTKNYGAAVSNAASAAAGQSSNYAATYWPWVQLFSTGLGKAVWAPASTVVGGAYAFNDQVAASWFAPAGLNRGGVPSVLRAERKLTQSDRDTLYNANVNPLATFPGEGVVIFGQKTLQRKPTALDRVNVRRLLIALKDFIGQVANNLVFEQNTNVTRNRFLAQVNPYLESVVQRQGLYAYRVVMDDSNNTPDVIDRNQLVGQIYIQPTKTAEFIILNFNVLPTGATFPA